MSLLVFAACLESQACLYLFLMLVKLLFFLFVCKKSVISFTGLYVEQECSTSFSLKSSTHVVLLVITLLHSLTGLSRLELDYVV